MLSKEAKTRRISSVGLLLGGRGLATRGSHFGLRRRALFITTFVCLSELKKKKLFFFSEEVRVWSLRIVPISTEFVPGSGSCAAAVCWARPLSWEREKSCQGGAGTQASGTMHRDKGLGCPSPGRGRLSEVRAHSTRRTVHTAKGLSRTPHAVSSTRVS